MQKALALLAVATTMCSAQESGEAPREAERSHILWATSWEAAVREASARNVPLMLMVVSNTG
ncbi:MAG: hypothetical protein HY716_01905 [Planctomycetes bacterium]|nr:hypothetical protein [Planctomycetota bacterium]